MKVAVFGGSFDPLHISHEKIINHLIENFDLVYIVPVQNYMKKDFLIPIEDRIKIIKNIYKNNSKIKVLDNILYDKEFTYTYNVILHVNKNHLNDNIYITLGSDYKNIEDWKNYKEILKLSQIYKISRDGLEGIDIKTYSISSSKIKENIILYKKFINSLFFHYIVEKSLHK